jgi:hypothetical protein
MMQSLSPTPKHKTKTEDLDFYDALRAVMIGKSITKLEWGNRNIFGILKDGHLMLRKADNRYYDWILSDGDLRGDDYLVIT